MHIILNGPTTPEDIWLAFEPTEFRESGIHFKALEALLLHDKTSVLIRSLVVERGFPKTFFLKIAVREDGIQISLEPVGKPDSTEALKRWIGLVAWSILQSAPEMTGPENGGLETYVRAPEESV